MPAENVEPLDVDAILRALHDDLVSMKRAAGRPDDRRDLHGLRQARGSE